jgi:hypothetical protein
MNPKYLSILRKKISIIALYFYCSMKYLSILRDLSILRKIFLYFLKKIYQWQSISPQMSLIYDELPHFNFLTNDYLCFVSIVL